MTHSNAPLRVFPSTASAFFIMPDGSLWRWGQAGGWTSRAVIPEQVGTNSDWLEVAAAGGRCVGLRRDGTLWDWGRRGGNLSSDPQPVSLERDWVGIGAASTYSVALRRDGTIWTWGKDPLKPFGLSPVQDKLVQFGTNQDWSAVACQWSGSLGLRSNGTIWAWGRVMSSGQNGYQMSNLSAPTRLCRDTNFVEFTTAAGSWVQARTRTGELWELLHGPPNPEAPVGAIGQLVASNALPGHVASAFCGKPKAYELRADGTLWERTCPMGLWTATPDKPRRVGKRSDWVCLWGGGGTALGLTADGTLWTWGYDGSRAR